MIVNMCEEEGDGDAVGSLTAGDRDTYYKVFCLIKVYIFDFTRYTYR